MPQKSGVGIKHLWKHPLMTMFTLGKIKIDVCSRSFNYSSRLTVVQALARSTGIHYFNWNVDLAAAALLITLQSKTEQIRKWQSSANLIFALFTASAVQHRLLRSAVKRTVLLSCVRTEAITLPLARHADSRWQTQIRHLSRTPRHKSPGKQWPFQLKLIPCPSGASLLSIIFDSVCNNGTCRSCPWFTDWMRSCMSCLHYLAPGPD